MMTTIHVHSLHLSIAFVVVCLSFLRTIRSVGLTHNAVCAVGGSGGAGGGAVVISPAPAARPSVEAGHGRKAGVDVC